MIISGFNPILESIKAGKATRLFLKKGVKFKDEICSNSITKIYLEAVVFDRKFGTNHGGFAADVDIDYKTLKNIDTNVHNLLVLDHIQDPQNFGTILRAAHCFNFNNIVVAKDNQVKITDTVIRASSGAIMHMDIYEVVNIARTIDLLKKSNFTVYIADPRGDINIGSTDISDKTIIVVGSEGKGVRENILKRADYKISIPMASKIDSLNVSHSAAIILYEFYKKFTTVSQNH